MSGARGPDLALLEKELRDLGATAPRDVVVLAEIDSTSDELKRRLRAGAAGPGTLVIAETQTAGRGRLGRAWWSPPAGHLYASLAVAVPGPPDERVPLVPLAAGAAAADALAALDVRGVLLKWPNDLLRGGRKVGGILCEAPTVAETTVVIVGLGVNTGVSRFGGELARTAGCLGDEGSAARPERVAARWAIHLESLVSALVRCGPEPVVAAWKRCAEPFGRRVRAGDLEGTTEGLDARGRLLIRTGAGETIAISGGIVEDATPSTTLGAHRTPC
ncbi:MAG: biotin--[acetyl-CoA-carboxylase] ligase [Proteobacteria bacterium]|jgi:BirA family biotin operon repressor/biotin-[acetyl-CoA-carboxylase] ligase|nr:biotin--[acetyl-CoA-carboxylase] ligase [Pseudomonadota bacterium]